MEVSIRKFEFEDIPLKVKWINNSNNNKYLHYQLPLDEKKTEEWFLKNKSNLNRYDALIEVDKEPVGIIGLINIDYSKKKAEYYITIGEEKFKGKNIATEASKLLLNYAFTKIKLEKVYLTTEIGNISMQKLAKKLSMICEAKLSDYSLREGELVDVFYYSVVKRDFFNQIVYSKEILSEIEFVSEDDKKNKLYIKRDDLLPFSFGGNKARKAKEFFDEILKGGYNVVITYGSKFSNHCRVISNLCSKYGIKCLIISPMSRDKSNFNQKLINLCGALTIECEVDQVSDTIEATIREESKKKNQKVYFIPGGGHGNLGTKAYVDAYNEIELWTRNHDILFDYIFLASGTGTTQAGLIVGNIIHNNDIRIVGISVARGKLRGSEVIVDSVNDYLKKLNLKNKLINLETVEFYDNYVESEYGKTNNDINSTIQKEYMLHSIPLSSNYTGKAFTGMKNFLVSNDIEEKNILFLHTGGAPLFFDDLNDILNSEE